MTWRSSVVYFILLLQGNIKKGKWKGKLFSILKCILVHINSWCWSYWRWWIWQSSSKSLSFFSTLAIFFWSWKYNFFSHLKIPVINYPPVLFWLWWVHTDFHYNFIRRTNQPTKIKQSAGLTNQTHHHLNRKLHVKRKKRKIINEYYQMLPPIW